MTKRSLILRWIMAVALCVGSAALVGGGAPAEARRSKKRKKANRGSAKARFGGTKGSAKKSGTRRQRPRRIAKAKVAQKPAARVGSSVGAKTRRFATEERFKTTRSRSLGTRRTRKKFRGLSRLRARLKASPETKALDKVAAEDRATWSIPSSGVTSKDRLTQEVRSNANPARSKPGRRKRRARYKKKKRKSNGTGRNKIVDLRGKGGHGLQVHQVRAGDSLYAWASKLAALAQQTGKVQAVDLTRGTLSKVVVAAHPGDRASTVYARISRPHAPRPTPADYHQPPAGANLGEWGAKLARRATKTGRPQRLYLSRSWHRASKQRGTLLVIRPGEAPAAAATRAQNMVETPPAPERYHSAVPGGSIDEVAAKLAQLATQTGKAQFYYTTSDWRDSRRKQGTRVVVRPGDDAASVAARIRGDRPSAPPSYHSATPGTSGSHWAAKLTALAKSTGRAQVLYFTNDWREARNRAGERIVVQPGESAAVVLARIESRTEPPPAPKGFHSYSKLAPAGSAETAAIQKLIDIANATRRRQRLFLTQDWRSAKPFRGLVTVSPGDSVEAVRDRIEVSQP